jgi:hypothetical protein
VSNDDRAPRWLVRWLITAVLLVLLVGIGYWITWELTFPDRMEAQLHRLNCDYARRLALLQEDPQKAALLATSAQLVCLGE